ncbi:MAG: protein kinase, partial [Myxococcales bacterium]|nr:protein kinase [Myxococcales bacterium]
MDNYISPNDANESPDFDEDLQTECESEAHLTRPSLLEPPECDEFEHHRSLANVLKNLCDVDPEVPRLGHYEVRGRIGYGGMGVVYAAHDPDLGRDVAIKRLLRPTSVALRRRLIREARIMARLHHPNVVTVFNIGDGENGAFIVMELIDGLTLREHLAHNRPQWDEIIQLFLAAGRGLSAAHDNGIIHRDFKPDNVMVGEDGRVRVMDFGIACRDPWMTGEDCASLATRTGSIAGTGPYMAKEQRCGGRPDARSDQYAFCVSLYESLHGHRPDQVPDLGLHIEPASTAMDEESRKAINEVLRRGRAEDASDRYSSMRALLGELEAILERVNGQRGPNLAVLNTTLTHAQIEAALGRALPSEDRDLACEILAHSKVNRWRTLAVAEHFLCFAPLSHVKQSGRIRVWLGWSTEHECLAAVKLVEHQHESCLIEECPSDLLARATAPLLGVGRGWYATRFAIYGTLQSVTGVEKSSPDPHVAAVWDFVGSRRRLLLDPQEHRERIRDLFLNLCEHALTALHDAGIIHRDIKPANLLVLEVDGRYELRVCGLSTAILHDETGTFHGFGSGTVEFAAPETCSDPHFKSDVYSMAVSLAVTFEGTRRPSDFPHKLIHRLPIGSELKNTLLAAVSFDLDRRPSLEHFHRRLAEAPLPEDPRPRLKHMLAELMTRRTLDPSGEDARIAYEVLLRALDDEANDEPIHWPCERFPPTGAETKIITFAPLHRHPRRGSIWLGWHLELERLVAVKDSVSEHEQEMLRNYFGGLQRTVECVESGEGWYATLFETGMTVQHRLGIKRAGTSHSIQRTWEIILNGREIYSIQDENHSSTVCEIFLRTAEVLECFAQQQLVHRDFKPSNWIVKSDQPGSVEIVACDFDAATLGTEQVEAEDDNLYFSVGFTAPEAATCPSPKSDIFSYCMSLATLLAGHAAPNRDSAEEYIRNLRETINPDLADMLERGVKSDPSRRPDSREFVEFFRDSPPLRRRDRRITWNDKLRQLSDSDGLDGEQRRDLDIAREILGLDLNSWGWPDPVYPRSDARFWCIALLRDEPDLLHPVWLAWDRDAGRLAAVHACDPLNGKASLDERARFERTVKVLRDRAINHAGKHIVEYLDAGPDWYATRWIHGVNLRFVFGLDDLRRSSYKVQKVWAILGRDMPKIDLAGSPGETRRARTVLANCAVCIRALHQDRLVHRGIRPDVFIVSNDLSVRLGSSFNLCSHSQLDHKLPVGRDPSFLPSNFEDVHDSIDIYAFALTVATVLHRKGDPGEQHDEYVRQIPTGTVLRDCLVEALRECGPACDTSKATARLEAIHFELDHGQGRLHQRVQHHFAWWALALVLLGTVLTAGTRSRGSNVVEVEAELDSAHWTADKVYVIKHDVFVMPGQSLHIDPGTVIRSEGGGLFVLPTARIEAKGSANRPIVFTSEDNLPWRGLVLLGCANVNVDQHANAEVTNSDGNLIPSVTDWIAGLDRMRPGCQAINFLEGCPRVDLENPRCMYGGGLADDDSGVLEYVRIENAGQVTLRDWDQDSLTLAGVGSSTRLSHVAVINATDDCFKFHGGNVSGDHLICLNPGDDGFDLDLGYFGELSFLRSSISGESLHGAGE